MSHVERQCVWWTDPQNHLNIIFHLWRARTGESILRGLRTCVCVFVCVWEAVLYACVGVLFGGPVGRVFNLSSLSQQPNAAQIEP